MGDTKSGTFIGKDNYGNKYWENNAEELPRAQHLANESKKGRRTDQTPSQSEQDG